MCLVPVGVRPPIAARFLAIYGSPLTAIPLVIALVLMVRLVCQVSAACRAWLPIERPLSMIYVRTPATLVAT
jgi:hypothetical protein